MQNHPEVGASGSAGAASELRDSPNKDSQSFALSTSSPSACVGGRMSTAVFEAEIAEATLPIEVPNTSLTATSPVNKSLSSACYLRQLKRTPAGASTARCCNSCRSCNSTCGCSSTSSNGSSLHWLTFSVGMGDVSGTSSEAARSDNYELHQQQHPPSLSQRHAERSTFFSYIRPPAAVEQSGSSTPSAESLEASNEAKHLLQYDVCTPHGCEESVSVFQQSNILSASPQLPHPGQGSFILQQQPIQLAGHQQLLLPLQEQAKSANYQDFHQRSDCSKQARPFQHEFMRERAQQHQHSQNQLSPALQQGRFALNPIQTRVELAAEGSPELHLLSSAEALQHLSRFPFPVYDSRGVSRCAETATEEQQKLLMKALCSAECQTASCRGGCSARTHVSPLGCNLKDELTDGPGASRLNEVANPFVERSNNACSNNVDVRAVQEVLMQRESRPLRLSRFEMVEAYAKSTLCLSCDSTQHKITNCPFGEFVCPNCHRPSHRGEHCPLPCRFCFERHLGTSVNECIRRTVRQPLERLLNVKMPLLAPPHRSLNDTSLASGSGLLLQQTAQRPDTPHGRSVYISSMPPGTSKESVRAAVAAALPPGVGFVVSVEMKQRSNMMPYAFVELSSLQAAYELVLNHAHRLLLGQQELKVQFKKIGLASPESNSGAHGLNNSSTEVPLQPFAGDGHSVFEICHMVSIKLARDFGLTPPAVPSLSFSDAIGGTQTSGNVVETAVKGTHQQVKSISECPPSPLQQLLIQAELPESKMPSPSIQAGHVTCCRQAQKWRASDNCGDARAKAPSTLEQHVYSPSTLQHTVSRQKLQCSQQQLHRGAQAIKCNAAQGGYLGGYESSISSQNLEQQHLLQHQSIHQQQLLLLQYPRFHSATPQLQALCRDGPLISIHRHNQLVVDPSCHWESLQSLTQPHIQTQSPDYQQGHSLHNSTGDTSELLQAMQVIHSIPDLNPQQELQHAGDVGQPQNQRISEENDETRAQAQLQRETRRHLSNAIWKESSSRTNTLRVNNESTGAGVVLAGGCNTKDDLDDGMTPLAGVYTPRTAAEAARSETRDFAEAQVCEMKVKQQTKQQQSLPQQVWRREESLEKHAPLRNITKQSVHSKEREEKQQLQEPSGGIQSSGFQKLHSELPAFFSFSSTSGVQLQETDNPRMLQIVVSKADSTGQTSRTAETQRLQEECNFVSEETDGSSSAAQTQENYHCGGESQDLIQQQQDLGVQRQQIQTKQRYHHEQDGSTFKRELEELMGTPPTSYSDCVEPHLQFTHTPHLGQLIKQHAQQLKEGDAQYYHVPSHIGSAEAHLSVTCSLENFPLETSLINAVRGPMPAPPVGSQDVFALSTPEPVASTSTASGSRTLISASPKDTIGEPSYEFGTSHGHARGTTELQPECTADERSLGTEDEQTQEKKNMPGNTLHSNHLLCKASEPVFEENMKLRFISRLSSMTPKRPGVSTLNPKTPLYHNSSSAVGIEHLCSAQAQTQEALLTTAQLPIFDGTSQAELQRPDQMQEQTGNLSLENGMPPQAHKDGSLASTEQSKPSGDTLVQDSGKMPQERALLTLNGPASIHTSEQRISKVNSFPLVPSFQAPMLPTGRDASFAKLSLVNGRHLRVGQNITEEDGPPGLDAEEYVDLKLKLCLQVSMVANI